MQQRTRSGLVTITLISVLVLSSQGLSAADPSTLHLASDQWPPFTGEEDTPRIAIELVQTALDRVGIPVETDILEWRNVEKGIEIGKFDGSAAIWRTEDRERTLLFSRPFLENRLVLVARKGTEVAGIGLGDLGGKRVAVVSRYAHGPAFEQADGVLFVGGRSDQENLSELLDGSVDYMLIDALVARYLTLHQPDETTANLEIGTTPLARRTLHFALRKEVPKAPEILEAFNAALQSMLSDGTFAEILNVGWIRVDVDGDGRSELVALGDAVGDVPPGEVFDVFGSAPEEPQEQPRVLIRGNIFEGWDAIPDRYKGPSDQNAVTYKRGVTVFTLQF